MEELCSVSLNSCESERKLKCVQSTIFKIRKVLNNYNFFFDISPDDKKSL